MAGIQPLKASQFRKLQENQQSTYVVYYYRADCRTCEDALDELQDSLEAYEAVVPVLSVNCSILSFKEHCVRFDSLPALLVYNTNLENPVPQQYLQEFEAERIAEFVQEFARPNFMIAKSTMALLEFLVTNAAQGRWVFMTTVDETPDWWFFEYAARLAKRGVTLLLQTGCDYEQYQDYEKASFFDKIDEDGINLFAAIDGTIQFYAWEMFGSLDLEGNINLADQWITEILDAFDSGLLHGVDPEQQDEL